MTTQDEINKLLCFKKLLEQNRPLQIAAQTAHAQKCERIFTEGLNSSGTQIGEYSTDSIYINARPNATPKNLKAEGKHGAKVFKSGKKAGQPHVTKYFGGGYYQYKFSQGANASFVNLTNFGNLKSNFENRSRGVPSVNKVSKDEYNSGLDKENSLKKDGLEDKYNANIFHHTEVEKKEFYRILGLELKNEIANCK